MKYLILVSTLLLVACGPAPTPRPIAEIEQPITEGCTVDTSSRLANQRKVGEITNLVKDEIEWGAKNECIVKFDITVDGTLYHLEESASGLEQMASICYYAKERARKNLLLELGGTFQTESNIKCVQRDG
jgi:hypothetical protein